MTRDEIQKRLKIIRDQGGRALQLLEAEPLSTADHAEIQSIARWLKEELQLEYNRMLPTRVQKTMTIYELSIYSPTIEEAWKETGISRLKTDGIPDQKWRDSLEAVVYKAGKYLS